MDSPETSPETTNDLPRIFAQSHHDPEQVDPSSNPELLRLRGEISVLRREIDATAHFKVNRTEAEADWAFAHSGFKPSDHPDFIFFTNCLSAGATTPEAALQTFYSSMRNQDKNPVTSTRMKQLWDVPEDFDEPDAGYSIDLGEGMGSEYGYRVTDQKPLNTNAEQMTLEFERPDGSVFRRKIVLVNRNGSWRIQPVAVSKATTN
jgi:hypothetical protein